MLAFFFPTAKAAHPQGAQIEDQQQDFYAEPDP